jgi:hypothetical protein
MIMVKTASGTVPVDLGDVAVYDTWVYGHLESGQPSITG